MGVYTTTSSVQNYTNVGTDEFSTTALAEFITNSTNEIDRRTGRTWQGTQTSTNEYYDGNGSDTLELNQTDLASVTSLTIYDDEEQTSSKTVTGNKVMLLDNGRIKLNGNCETETFTKGKRTVKITYTYGNSSVPNDVELLCKLMVAQMIKMEDNRQAQIEELTELLSFRRVHSV